jgi:hypothetical protein
MVKRAVAIIFSLLMLCGIAAAAPGTLKITKADTASTISALTTPIKTVTLEEARVKEDNSSSANTSSNISQPVTKTESIPESDIVSGWVTTGLNNWLKGLIGGMYASFENNSAVNDKFGTPRGALYTAITYVPDPYDDPAIKSLFHSYNNLAIFFVVIFIFGTWANRNLSRSKVTFSVFGEKDLSTSALFSGIAMCIVALFGNFIYMFALQIIQALSQYAMLNVLDSIAPAPDNLILYAMMAVCDLTVFVFFLIRYFIIYAVAVLCTVIAVLLVPEFSRDFAKKSIDHILRILLLQPVTIFFTCLGIVALKNLPANSGIQALGYVGLTILVFLVCWYMLWGNFEFVKKAARYAVTVATA